MSCWFDSYVCVLVDCGWGCGLLCFADLVVGMFDSCLVVFVVMVVYVWLGAFSCGLFGVFRLLFWRLRLFVGVCELCVLRIVGAFNVLVSVVVDGYDDLPSCADWFGCLLFECGLVCCSCDVCYFMCFRFDLMF